MKILVTGGLGFVGINLVRDLACETGADVVAADVLPVDGAIEAFLQPVAKRVTVCSLDVRDAAAYRRIVLDHQITHIIHAAAITPGPEREREQAPFVVDVNLVGAVNALNIAFETPAVARMLLVSSSGVYRVTPTVPGQTQLEDSPLDLSHLYAITKYAGELLAQRYAGLTGKPIASVRLGSVFGPMERPTGSRQHLCHIRRLQMALEENRPVKVAGPGVNRDWVYTHDVSAALRALLAAPRWNYPVYNIGSGQSVLFRDLVGLFEKRGLRAEWVDSPAEAEISMIPSQERPPMDLTRLVQDTGFAPHYAGLDGIAKVLKDSTLL